MMVASGRIAYAMLVFGLLYGSTAGSANFQDQTAKQPEQLITPGEILEVKAGQVVAFVYTIDDSTIDPRSSVYGDATFKLISPISHQDQGKEQPSVYFGLFAAQDIQHYRYAARIPLNQPPGIYKIDSVSFRVDNKESRPPLPDLVFEVVEDLTYHPTDPTRVHGHFAFNPTKAQFFQSRAHVVRSDIKQLKQNLSKVQPRDVIAIRDVLLVTVHTEIEQLEQVISAYPSLEPDKQRANAGIAGLKDIESQYEVIRRRLQTERLHANVGAPHLVLVSAPSTAVNMEDSVYEAINNNETAYMLFAESSEYLENIQVGTIPEQNAKVSYYTLTEHYDLPRPTDSSLDRIHYAIWTFIAKKDDLCGKLIFDGWTDARREIVIPMEKAKSPRDCEFDPNEREAGK